MYMHSKHGLMSGATALAMSPGLRAPEVKDADLGALTTELKKSVEGLVTAQTAFQSKNDQALAEIRKGVEDAVTKDELQKINKSLDDAIAAVKKQMEETEAKANRLALSGPTGEVQAKHLEDFAKMVGKKDVTLDQMREFKSALAGYLRNPELKATTLMVGADPAGGYWVSPDRTGRMVKKIYETTPMRQLANVVVIGTDALEGAIDNGEADATWVGEVSSRPQTDIGTTGVWRIPAHELYAYPRVTQKLLDDATIDVEAWLTDKAVSKFSRKENNAFCVGDGINKPRGLFDYVPVATADDTRSWGVLQFVATGQAGGFPAANPADKLLDLIFEVKAGYRSNAKFLMARRTMGAVRKLKDGDGNYLTSLRLADGALVETIFGFPNVDGEDVPALAADSLSIAFGDFAEAYTIVDRLGVSVVRDNITTPGFVKYNMRKRVGGDVTNFEAVKFLKFT